ncbi:two component transcriptional regulator, LytTR family [Microbulbifer donghaiensis]|uniref:Two component transcriptional regulator, LytTR family n=1 Tax=Microbulbifer donghaiensis TaxID=494016 RepID=A0A1M5B5N6_9GAMM|nr:LytTR family DNA-binding domain-containing protein [Microbulbifer donghaiensis]SHF37750.1 two component transcriptional regulator, LytTR family [Microbulbifer donghaiensis]
MKPLRIVVVDDEPLALRLAKSMLQEIPFVDVVAACKNGREALEAISRHCPDLIFLDIQMPGMNGFEVVRRLQGDTIPLVVFATAYDQYALEAFEVNAVDYVMKPLEDDRLELAIRRARERLQLQTTTATGQREPSDRKGNLLQSIERIERARGDAPTEPVAEQAHSADTMRRLAVKDRGRITMLNPADIEWIDAAGDYMCVHAAGETHVMRSTMKELQQQLCGETFKRIHRSTVVNLNFVNNIKVLSKGEYMLTLESGAQLKVSRNYRQPVKEYLDASRSTVVS